ncbi:MAG: hypothetical protein ACP5SH_11855 [Syntrophobacteraceae bacterium]
MQEPGCFRCNQKLLSVFVLLATLALIGSLDNSFYAAALLLPLWYMIYRPVSRLETVSFILASLFFVLQDYSMGRSGGSSFKHRDILLMPWYELFLWGFYYLNMKRFTGDNGNSVVLDRRGIFGLLLTAALFPLFSWSPRLLLLATVGSTAILFTLFHDPMDLYCAAYFLGLGFVVEFFGVSHGLWRYPHQPEFLGIPYWCATMWISAGILGRRVLFPLADLLDDYMKHAKHVREAYGHEPTHGYKPGGI